MGASVSMLFMLLMGNPLSGLLGHPPQDLASLLDPAAVLQKMNVSTAEADLITLLRTAAGEPKENAGEGDMLFVKKLMAIRLIEKNKSALVAPVLQEVANGADTGLRDAAKEAMAAMEGKPIPRPKGAALLKDLAQELPPDIGFVVALDLERDSKAVTARALVDALLKDAGDKGGLNLLMGGNGGQDMQQEINRGLDEFDKGIINALSHVGNIRIDAAVAVFSTGIGAKPGQGNVGIVVKGQYDLERIVRAMKSEGGMGERKIAGRKVYCDTITNPQYCLLDANTFVMAIPEDRQNIQFMESLLVALAGPAKPPQKALAPAFDLVAQGKARLALAGALSAEQKKLINTFFMENVKPHEGAGGPEEELKAAGSQFMLKLAQAESYTVAIDLEGKLVIQAVAADAAAAKSLGDSSTQLQKLFFDLRTKEAGNAPSQFKPIMDQLTKAGILWKTEVAEKSVTLKVDSFMTMALGALFGMRETVVRQEDIHMK